jgi:hypothetical protein
MLCERNCKRWPTTIGVPAADCAATWKQGTASATAVTLDTIAHRSFIVIPRRVAGTRILLAPFLSASGIAGRNCSSALLAQKLQRFQDLRATGSNASGDPRWNPRRSWLRRGMRLAQRERRNGTEEV